MMLLQIAWRHNLDGFDVALAINRLMARGAPVWWLGGSGGAIEPGDYLCEVGDDVAARLARFGVIATPWVEPIPDRAAALAYPRVALFAGTASAFPDFAFYAIALARLGFDFALVDGASIAAGALVERDIVILPAGFAVWGLDAAERVEGADVALRRFLAGGGAAVGSGGGAACLSAGRPGWAGTARALPHYSHEYLRTGVAIVSVRLGLDSVGFGCPPTLEMPYFHGPVYDELDRAVSSAATFNRLVMSGRLFVANPLEGELFDREMAGRAAILRAEGPRGHAVLFSVAPEMGDLVRKYIAFDSYVPRYLAIAGEAVMAETLRHYRMLESPSFRLILNAIHSLMLRTRPPAPRLAPAMTPLREEPAPALIAAVDRTLAALSVADDDLRAGLAETLRGDLRARLAGAPTRLAAAQAALSRGDRSALAIGRLWAEIERAAAAWTVRPDAARPPAEVLAEIETRIALLEAWCGLAEAEAHFGLSPS
jgi:hypothetical protein